MIANAECGHFIQPVRPNSQALFPPCPVFANLSTGEFSLFALLLVWKQFGFQAGTFSSVLKHSCLEHIYVIKALQDFSMSACVGFGQTAAEQGKRLFSVYTADFPEAVSA